MLKLTIASLCCWLGSLAFVAIAISLPSSVFTEYVYNYEANIAFEPNDSLGFKIKAKAHLEFVYSTSTTTTTTSDISNSGETRENLLNIDQSSQLVRLRLSEPIFYKLNPETAQYKPLVINRKFQHLYDENHDLYAHIVTLSNGTAIIKELYTHQADSATFKNLKKSILLNLLPTNHHTKPVLGNTNFKTSLLEDDKSNDGVCIDDNNLAQPELFSPDSISSVKIIAEPKVERSIESTTTGRGGNTADPNNFKPIIYQTVNGYQNLTFGSRVFSEAQSNLTTDFHLELINELKSKTRDIFVQANSIRSAINLIAEKQDYQADTIELQRERRICSHHHCGKSLQQLFNDYQDSLTDEALASVESAVAVLRLLERLRDSKGTTVKDILQILKRIKGHDGVESSVLDILAAARTKDSILAAFKHVKLAKNNNLDVAERFLSVLSVVAKTASKMQLKRPLLSPYYFTRTNSLKRSKELREQESHLASIKFIAQELLQIIKQTPAQKWASYKLRWSSLLTLATLINANNQERLTNNMIEFSDRSEDDDLNDKISALLLSELGDCDISNTDCRIVMLQAIGNVGILTDKQFFVLKDQILNSGRRESISAMRTLRDLLQVQAKDKPLPQTFYTNLKDLLLRVVYDNSHETTARVLAAEVIVRFLPNSLASEDLLMHLPSFNNNELATMIYSRMQSLKPNTLAKHNDNWYWKSCIINGTSTSFVRQMARTDSLNASYGVNVELMNRGKILKESSFDVFLDTKKRTQDLFSLGIFARGLSSFAGGGGDDDGSEDENESSMAGMTLRLLGGYLRPYVFFTGTGELMSHIWQGTASEPTTAFNGNLLLIDHMEGYPLISGFVAEQQMRGILSIDVSGKIKISIWHKSSHSVVRTKASIIVQASQSIFTSYDDFWQSHLFSFGGQALIDFVADSSFSSPPKICLQVTQPEFMLRYNSRARYQMMANEISRKLTRKNFSIGAKSYSLNSENNKMCLLMNDEL